MPVRRFAIVAAAVAVLSMPAAPMSERWRRCVLLRKAPSHLHEGLVIGALLKLYTDQRHRILRIRRLRCHAFPPVAVASRAARRREARWSGLTC